LGEDLRRRPDRRQRIGVQGQRESGIVFPPALAPSERGERLSRLLVPLGLRPLPVLLLLLLALALLLLGLRDLLRDLRERGPQAGHARLDEHDEQSVAVGHGGRLARAVVPVLDRRGEQGALTLGELRGVHIKPHGGSGSVDAAEQGGLLVYTEEKLHCLVLVLRCLW